MSDLKTEEYNLCVRYNYFDTSVNVIFVDTKDSISDTQKKTLEGFIGKQDQLTTEILSKIFEYYRSTYPHYKEGWTTWEISDAELEKNLPTPSTPENLKAFITPANIFIQSNENCEEGTIGIEFDCTWDIEHGLGVHIKNWKVVEAATAFVAYI